MMIRSTFLVVLILVQSKGSATTSCQFGQDEDSVWTLYSTPCEHCDKLVLGGANIKPPIAPYIKKGDNLRVIVAESTVSGNVSLSEETGECKDIAASRLELDCPKDITTSSYSNAFFSNAQWPAPVVSGNREPNPLVACDFESGGAFNIGTTTVQCNVADDGKDIFASCQFNVTVIDKEAPIIICPPDKIIPTQESKDYGIVIFSPPDVIDNSEQVTSTCSIDSGTAVYIGTSDIRCRAIDIGGNNAYCYFTVTVLDTEVPFIECPRNIEVLNSEVTTSVSWSDPIVTDNSKSQVDVFCIPESGSTFEIGITTVNCTAIDQAKLSASCQFEVRKVIEAPFTFIGSDCQTAQEAGYHTSGVYRVQPLGIDSTFDVFCDMDTEGGGWMLFQKRFDGSVDFYRNWEEYQNGFGEIAGEFWLGNEKLHRITEHRTWELRVDMGDWNIPMGKAYAKYQSFSIGSSDDKYKLTFDKESYNGSDSLENGKDGLRWHGGSRFATYDVDTNDTNPANKYACAWDCHGAWWFTSCKHSNLNGPWGGPQRQDIKIDEKGPKCEENISWHGFSSLIKFSEMKFRRM